jgi:hypothetical protein
LLKNPSNKREFAIDIYWKRLQATGRWYMITPPTVVQVEGFSDVEKRNTDYKHLMTDMNKEWLFAQPGSIPFNNTTSTNLPQQLNLGIKYRGSISGKMNLQPSKK